MKLLRKLSLWMMLLSVTGLVSGCESLPAEYCTTAQNPFRWESDVEIDATPIRPLRWIETEAAIWERVCGR